MKLVELIRGPADQRRDLRAVTKALAEKLGKTDDRARRTIPGFIVNRILIPHAQRGLLRAARGPRHGRGHRHRRSSSGSTTRWARSTLADLIGLDTVPGHRRGAAHGPRRRQVPPVPAAAAVRRGGLARPQGRARLLQVLTSLTRRSALPAATRGAAMTDRDRRSGVDGGDRGRSRSTARGAERARPRRCSASSTARSRSVACADRRSRVVILTGAGEQGLRRRRRHRRDGGHVAARRVAASRSWATGSAPRSRRCRGRSSRRSTASRSAAAASSRMACDFIYAQREGEASASPRSSSASSRASAARSGSPAASASRRPRSSCYTGEHDRRRGGAAHRARRRRVPAGELLGKVGLGRPDGRRLPRRAENSLLLPHIHS